MRISPTAKALAACLALVLTLSSCSLLDKSRGAKRNDKSVSGQDSTTATSDSPNAPTVDILKSFPLFKNSATSMRQQNCIFDFADVTEIEQSLKRYIKEEVECLNQAWQKPLDSSGAIPSPKRPGVRYTRKSPYDTDCSQNITQASAECARQGLTFQVSNDSYYLNDHALDTLWALMEVVSNYSYWLLDALGVTGTANKLADKAGGETAKAHEIYRRHNLSAWCLSGVYIGAQTRHNPDEQDFFNSIYNNQDNVIVDVSKSPEDKDIPTGQNYLNWFRKGIDSDGNPSACNTWIAPASEVS